MGTCPRGDDRAHTLLTADAIGRELGAQVPATTPVASPVAAD